MLGGDADDGSDATLLAKGEFAYERGRATMYINLPQDVTCRYVTLRGLSSHNGERFAGGAELRLHDERAPDFSTRKFDSSQFSFDVFVERLEADDTKVAKAAPDNPLRGTPGASTAASTKPGIRLAFET